MKARRKTRLVLAAASAAAVLLSLAAYAYALWNSPPTRFDDAYMFLRYAKNILAGHGHAWNPGGPQVFGSTSLLHVGVVTLWKCCLPQAADATVLWLASALPGVLALLLLVALCARLARHPVLRGNYLLWGGLVLPTLVFNVVVLYHHRTGMDTMLATLFNAALILVTLRLGARGSIGRLIPAVAVGYLTFLARPDNGIYATLLPVLWVLLVGEGPRWKTAGVFALSMAALLAVDAGLKWLVFGTPLPLSFYAKQHGVYAACGDPAGRNPFDYLRVFLSTAAPFGCLMLLLVNKGTLRPLLALLIPVALTFTYFFTVNQIMGGASRFYVPALPFFVVGAAIALDGWVRERRRGTLRQSRELLLRLVVALLVLAVGRHGLIHAAAWYNRRLPETPKPVSPRPYQIAAQEPLPPLDRWEAIQAVARLAARAPQGTVIALSEHGLVGASAQHVVLIDLVSLHEAEFALHGFSAAELFRRKPDLIWLPHYNYPRLVEEILAAEAFWDGYLYYPEAFILGIALRKDSPRFEELSALLAEGWQSVYGDRELDDYLAVSSE